MPAPGLKPAPISTQILQRICMPSFYGFSAYRFFPGQVRRGNKRSAKTEIRELEEPFYQGQKGSSAMPHKRNPVSCEQISGLARVVRANAQISLENIPLWHERDISHSSAERIILPDSTILVDYMLHQMNRIIKNLHVYPGNMLANLEKTGGLIYSQAVLLTLVGKGVSRERAYDLVQKYAMRSWEERVPFRQLLENDREIASLLTAEEIESCFDPQKHLRFVPYIYERLGLFQEKS